MMENAWFDFSFGMDKIEHSGRYFFTFYWSNAEFYFTSFADVSSLWARYFVTGLECLLTNNIARRDLKPGTLRSAINITAEWMWICSNPMLNAPLSTIKLADFGWRRFFEMQTNSFLQTKTESTCWGTPVFMFHLSTCTSPIQPVGKIQYAAVWNQLLPRVGLWTRLQNANLQGPDWIRHRKWQQLRRPASNLQLLINLSATIYFNWPQFSQRKCITRNPKSLTLHYRLNEPANALRCCPERRRVCGKTYWKWTDRCLSETKEVWKIFLFDIRWGQLTTHTRFLWLTCKRKSIQ